MFKKDDRCTLETTWRTVVKLQKEVHAIQRHYLSILDQIMAGETLKPTITELKNELSIFSESIRDIKTMNARIAWCEENIKANLGGKRKNAKV